MKTKVTADPATEAVTEADCQLLAQLKEELEKLRPIFWEEGGDARVRSVQDGVAHVLFNDGGAGCGGTIGFLKNGLRLTLLEKITGLKDLVFE